MVQTEEERKKYLKDYNSKPEVKARNKKNTKKYLESDKGKKTIAKRAAKPEVKAMNKKNKKKYNQSKKGQAKNKEYKQTPEYSAKQKEFRNSKRLKVLKHYSQSLSNSDIPCCNCCGLNSHIGFLALDHIAGKRKMDSESELVQLGYDSNMHPDTLLQWLIDNKFPKGFQILCHNCNLAKGYYGNCPLEGKPH